MRLCANLTTNELCPYNTCKKNIYYLLDILTGGLVKHSFILARTIIKQQVIIDAFQIYISDRILLRLLDLMMFALY